MSKKVQNKSKVVEEPIATPVVGETDAEFEEVIANAVKESKAATPTAAAPVAVTSIDSGDESNMAVYSFLAVALVGYYYFWVYHARSSTDLIALAAICVVSAILLSIATKTVAARRFRMLQNAFNAGRLTSGNLGGSAAGFGALTNIGAFFFLFYLFSTHVLPSARGIVQAPAVTDNLYFDAGISALVPAVVLVMQANAAKYLF